MTPERREELLTIIARAFPETARIIRSMQVIQMSDLRHGGKRTDGQYMSPTARLESSRLASKKVRERRLAEGKCRDCENPRVLGSMRFCAEHRKRHNQYSRKYFLKRSAK